MKKEDTWRYVKFWIVATAIYLTAGLLSREDTPQRFINTKIETNDTSNRVSLHVKGAGPEQDH